VFVGPATGLGSLELQLDTPKAANKLNTMIVATIRSGLQNPLIGAFDSLEDIFPSLTENRKKSKSPARLLLAEPE
jgi:hypothetical protein